MEFIILNIKPNIHCWGYVNEIADVSWLCSTFLLPQFAQAVKQLAVGYSKVIKKKTAVLPSNEKLPQSIHSRCFTAIIGS